LSDWYYVVVVAPAPAVVVDLILMSDYNYSMNDSTVY